MHLKMASNDGKRTVENLLVGYSGFSKLWRLIFLAGASIVHRPTQVESHCQFCRIKTATQSSAPSQGRPAFAELLGRRAKNDRHRYRFRNSQATVEAIRKFYAGLFYGRSTASIASRRRGWLYCSSKSLGSDVCIGGSSLRESTPRINDPTICRSAPTADVLPDLPLDSGMSCQPWLLHKPNGNRHDPLAWRLHFGR